jgi:hypothetical protein
MDKLGITGTAITPKKLQYPTIPSQKATPAPAKKQVTVKKPIKK